MSLSPVTSIITVAIVEDDARIRRSLTEILNSDDGLRCVGSFGSGEEAVKHLSELAPMVVLMDINLPGMNGVECVRFLSKSLPKYQIIMLTVREDSDILFESLEAGASGYLLKPPRANDLIAAVRNVTEGGAPMTASIARRVVRSFSRRTAASREIDQLTQRENQVLDLLSKGFSYKEIASDLDISYSTVQKHIEKVYKKLHVHSCSQAIAKYLSDE